MVLKISPFNSSGKTNKFKNCNLGFWFKTRTLSDHSLLNKWLT